MERGVKMKRKTIVKDRNELANILAKLEGGKSQAKVADVRQAMKLLVSLEAAGIAKGRKSIFMMLRREAHTVAKKIKK
jgi:hypothetical protein